VLAKVAPYLLTTLIGVLLVIASILGAAAITPLVLAAGALGVLLILVVIGLSAQQFRGSRRRTPPLFVGVLHADGRPPTVHSPSSGRMVAPIPPNGRAEVSLRGMADGDKQAFLRSVEAAKQAGPPNRQEFAAPRQVPALPDVYDEIRKEPERESLQREARRVRDTYRAMARTNGIENATGEVKRSMQERIDRLNDRLNLYRAKWSVSDVNGSAYVPEQPQVGPTWLRAMVREADLVVWQLDHEGR
jgi:hypothetical protein